MTYGIILAVVSAVLWAGLDAARKSLAATLSPLVVVAAMTVGQAALFAGWMVVEGGGFYSPAYALPGGVCLALNIAANVMFVEAVRISPLSLTIPFLSLSPAFAALAGMVLLGEFPSPRQWAGIAVVVGAALALNVPREAGIRGVLRAFWNERGCVLMTGVALLWAITISLDKASMVHASPGTHGVVQTAGVALVTTAYLLARGQTDELRKVKQVLPMVGFAAVVGAGALGVQFLAVNQILVGVVETLKRGVGLLAAVVVGRLAFAEPITSRKVLVAAAMILGTALVVL